MSSSTRTGTDGNPIAQDQGMPLDDAIERLRNQDPIGQLHAIRDQHEG